MTIMCNPTRDISEMAIAAISETMDISLKSIDELYQYTDVNKYINVIVSNQSTHIDVRIIDKIASNKPNYQLHCSNKSVITMAYSYIPDDIQFIIRDNTTLHRPKRKMRQSSYYL
jgi:hypothetical protein